jgi:hypothetical protein
LDVLVQLRIALSFSGFFLFGHSICIQIQGENL